MKNRIAYLTLAFGFISSINTAVFDFSNGSSQTLYVWPLSKDGKIVAILPPKSLAVRMEVPTKYGSKPELMVLDDYTARLRNIIQGYNAAGAYSQITGYNKSQNPENYYVLDYSKGNWTAYTPIKYLKDIFRHRQGNRKDGEWKQSLGPSFKDARFAKQIKKY